MNVLQRFVAQLWRNRPAAEDGVEPAKVHCAHGCCAACRCLVVVCGGREGVGSRGTRGHEVGQGEEDGGAGHEHQRQMLPPRHGDSSVRIG